HKTKNSKHITIEQLGFVGTDCNFNTVYFQQHTWANIRLNAMHHRPAIAEFSIAIGFDFKFSAKWGIPGNTRCSTQLRIKILTKLKLIGLLRHRRIYNEANQCIFNLMSM